MCRNYELIQKNMEKHSSDKVGSGSEAGSIPPSDHGRFASVALRIHLKRVSRWSPGK
jgi:hypothetical protein